MSDQNDYKAILTDFRILKQPYRIDKLIFFNIQKQKLTSDTARIVSIDDIYKEFYLAYNFNTNSLKTHIQGIVSIIQKIVISIKSLQ